MNAFKALNIINPEIEEYQIIPLREQDIFKIKEWRNSQIDVLRQNHELNDEEQIRYYHEKIEPTFSDQAPKQMLFSFLQKNECAGYGGLTNIDWEAKRAELSFLLNPERLINPSVYEKEFSVFLILIKRLAFDGIQLNRIFTETYDIRPVHVSTLEKNGFICEGRMRDHVKINGKYVDSLIHGFMKEYYVAGE